MEVLDASLGAGNLSSMPGAAAERINPHPGETSIGRSGATSVDAKWVHFSNWDVINALERENDTLWFATMGGAVRWNLSDNTYAVYSVLDGLGDNCVLALAIDRTGAKWFGTYGGGVSVYDGCWKTMTMQHGLPSNYVTALASAPEGGVWLGTVRGVRFVSGDLHAARPRKARALESEHVHSLHLDTQGTLWVATRGHGAARLSDDGCRFFTTADGLADNIVKHVIRDACGRVWAGTAKGLCLLQGNRWEVVSDGTELIRDSISCLAADRNGGLWCGTDGGLVTDSRGNLWYGSVGHGLLHFNSKTWSRHRAGQGLSHDTVRAIHVDEEDVPWVGTENGFCKPMAGRWLRYKTRAEGLSWNSVLSIHIDARNRKWLGTTRRGLCRLDGTTWWSSSDEEGAPSNNVQAVTMDRNHHVWCGTGRGAYEFDCTGRPLKIYSAADGLAGDYVSAVAVDEGGRVWFGTRGGGVSAFDGQAWNCYSPSTTNGAFQGRVVRAIAIDDESVKWFGTVGHGAYRFDDRSWTNYMTRDGLPSDNVYAIVIGARGVVWLGTDCGLSRLEDGNLTNFVSGIRVFVSILKRALHQRRWADMLQYLFKTRWRIVPALAGDYVRALTIDRHRALWVGTLGGVSSFDGRKWRKYTTRDGLCDHNVRSIAIDAEDDVWIGTIGGLSRLTTR